MKPVGKPDARNEHVRFDERGWEPGRRLASAPAPILDSTSSTKSENDLRGKVKFGGLQDRVRIVGDGGITASHAVKRPISCIIQVL